MFSLSSSRRGRRPFVPACSALSAFAMSLMRLWLLALF
jgi:hypothetical protein